MKNNNKIISEEELTPGIVGFILLTLLSIEMIKEGHGAWVIFMGISLGPVILCSILELWLNSSKNKEREIENDNN